MSNEKQQSSEQTSKNEDSKPKDSPSIEDELNNLSGGEPDIGDIFKNLGNDEGLSNLFKQFTNGFSNLGGQGEQSGTDAYLNPGDDDLDDIDLDSINLDKYFISKKGDNICDILHDIKEQLVVFNNNSNK
tara:strand:- start:321 stop:710 length:390 start_codon:yes stop_codon:yes gene_type:complete